MDISFQDTGARRKRDHRPEYHISNKEMPDIPLSAMSTSVGPPVGVWMEPTTEMSQMDDVPLPTIGPPDYCDDGATARYEAAVKNPEQWHNVAVAKGTAVEAQNSSAAPASVPHRCLDGVTRARTFWVHI